MAKFFLWSCKEGNMFVVCLCIVSSYFSTIAAILNISNVFTVATYVGLSWDNVLTDNLPCHFYFWHGHSYWILMYTYAQKHRCEFQSLWHLSIWSSSCKTRNSYHENIHPGPMVVDTEGSSVLLNSYLKNPKYTKIKKWNN